MNFLTALIATLGSWAIATIDTLGYGGLVFLMALESMIVPLPSELVMPFAGFLVADGKMSAVGVVLSSSLGSVIGSLISYYLGKYGGVAAVHRFGKYLLLDEEDLAKTQAWFSRRGSATIFIGRFVPVVRHLISIPAGMGNMRLRIFLIYTLFGATLWNSFLAYLGFILGQRWEEVRHYSEYFSFAVLGILVIGVVWFVWRHWGRK